MTHRQNYLQYRHRRRNRAQRMSRRLTTEQLETRVLLAGDLLQNPALVTDVNDDGFTSPVDALHVINELNIAGARSLRAGIPPAQPGLFYDVNGDEYLTPMDALLVLNELNGEGEDDDLVQIRLAATDSEGNALDSIAVGESFELRAFVQDLTGRETGGVFAAYMDVEYDSTLVAVDGDIVHSSTYGQGPSGSVPTPGLIDEVGSFDGFDPLGTSEYLLFTVPMTGSVDGNASFVLDPADFSPAHDVLVYGTVEGVPGDPSPVVPPERIAYLGTTLQVGQIDIPVAVDDDYNALEGQALTINAVDGVLANDTDPGGAELTAIRVDDPDSGVVQLNSDGSFVYTPDTNFTGPDSFTYLASNGENESNVATVRITVLPVNTPPVAVNDDYETNEDERLEPIDGVLINDFDEDEDPLTARLISNPSHGELIDFQLNGRFTYVPDDDFVGEDTFEYVANDGQDDSNVATVTIDVLSVNDPPVAQPDEYDAAKNTLLEISAEDGVLANDFDPDGDELTAVLVSDATDGDLVLSDDGSFTYTPDLDYTGQDFFTYVASDGLDTSEETLVTLNVAGDFQVRFRAQTTNLSGTPIDKIAPAGEFLLQVFVQDVSVVPRDGVFAAYMDVLYDSELVNVSGPIDFSPVYPNQQSGDTSPAGLIDEVGAFDGQTPLGEAERFLFSVSFFANNPGVAMFSTDPADFLPAHDTLLFGVNEAIPPSQIEYGTVSLTIEQGDPPVAVDDEYETLEDVELVITAEEGVLANDSDPNEDVLSAVLFSDVTHGQLNLNADGSFEYLPDEHFFGLDSFTYQATDGAQLSNLATVTIDVLPIDDAPVAVDDRYLVGEDPPLIVSAEDGVLANDFDVEGDPLSAVLVDGPSHGELLDFDSDGSFTYMPELGFVGQDTFTYQAIAGDRDSNVATVRIDVGDLRPSSIQGFVYVDTDNDGKLDEREYRIGGVRVDLTGVDLLGNSIDVSTRTDGDGSYRFSNLLQGNYTVTEFQATYMIDGKDTHTGQPSLRNDRFIVNLSAATTAGDYNFGERGLEPQFLLNPWFFASRHDDYLMTMVNGAGRMMWYVLDAGWDGFQSVNVKLAGNRSTAELVATGHLGQTQTTTVRVLGNPSVLLAGDATNGFLLNMRGSPEDYGFISPEFAEGEPLSSSAVDAAFSGDDA